MVLSYRRPGRDIEVKANLRNEFIFGINTDLVTSTSRNYRLPSWPPPRDWPVVIAKDGKVVSVWGDSRWDLTPWAGKRSSLNFGDGEKRPGRRAESLSAENADVMRMVAGWFTWGLKAVGAPSTLKTNFSIIRQVVALCNRNGISAANLMRYPKVLEQVPKVLAVGNYHSAILLLHRLYDARDVLGFVIVDARGLKRLAKVAPDPDIVQTPYIPPRIWLYQVKRLHECLTEFLAHKEEVEACFRYCVEAYSSNFGTIEAALTSGKCRSKNPFCHLSAERAGCTYWGKFADTAAQFGIAQLLKNWVVLDKEEMSVSHLSRYLTLITFAGGAYIANFTLQRKEELGSLRTSCLSWDEDEELGRVAIICGETTKTDPDSDARWVASPSVATAVNAASVVAHLRMECDRFNPTLRPTAEDQEDPYLLSVSSEPWSTGGRLSQSYEIRRELKNMKSEMKAACKRLFDQEELRITAEDLKIALRLTPNLPKNIFAVGKVWPLAWHQYRRTGAVNMFASGDISDSSMQQQMKHVRRLMPLYYGRNHSSLRLNREVEKAVVVAMYEAQAEKIMCAASGDRFISPFAPERKESFASKVLSVKDVRDLNEMANRGTVSFRENRLGGCMKAGVCEYGGIESVARCAGGDGGNPCTDALFDRAKESQVRADMRRVAAEMERLTPNLPRYKALVAEHRAMENFINAITAH